METTEIVKMKRILRMLFVVITMTGLLPCTAASNAPSHPDLCVVLVDSLRPGHLGCYGYERDTSPMVDAFAAGAVRFDQTVESCSRTQPSIMSMIPPVPADIHPSDEPSIDCR